MNEITQIHLGRQAFTISVVAHKELQDYLAALKKQVHDGGVVEEVELRMAELLTEHGITGDKVILPADVTFLKEQLGDPQDFSDDETPASTESKTGDAKRLFRDTDNAMLAGVAAGLSQYIGIDVWLIRIIFIIGIFTGGWGVLLYLVLWLLVPEAKTSSDRLLMAGKPVTVDSLKEIVERADVKGVATRANNSLAGPINTGFKIVLKIIGIGFMLFGLGALIGLVGLSTYAGLHSADLAQNNIFPIGLREHLLLYLTLAVAGIISLFIVLIGMSLFRRKWPISTWITGVLVGLTLIGIAVGGALAVDTAPQVRNRYQANRHTTVRMVASFTSLATSDTGDGISLRFQNSPTYSLSIRYFGNPRLSDIKTSVQNGVLTIDSQRFDYHRNCSTLCIPDTYDVVITVNSPNADQLVGPDIKDFPDVPSVDMPGHLYLLHRH